MEGSDDENNVLQAASKRRRMRTNLRSIIDEAQSKRAELENIGSNRFDEIRARNNLISHEITHTRELQLDLTVMKELATAVKAQAVKIDDMSMKFDVQSFRESLIEKFNLEDAGNRNKIAWSRLGRDVGVIFRCVPSFETMLGPMNREIKTRKVAERRVREEVVEDGVDRSKAKEIRNNEEDESEATNSRLVHLYTVVEDLSNEIRLSQTQPSQSGSDESPPVEESFVDLLQLLVDPSDDIQTVENFFDFSFLIKEKKVTVVIDEVTQLPQVISIPEGRNEDTPIQTVLSMNMKDLKELRTILNRIKSDPNLSKKLPGGYIKSYPSLHREDDLYSAPDVHAQADILQRRQTEGGDSQSQSQQLKQQRTSTSMQPPQKKAKN